MVRGPMQAIAWGKAQVGSRAWGGRCEAFTRSCFGLPGQYPSANAAWRASGNKHPGDFNAPAGVPVFWDLVGPNAPYGHVALSIGGGYAVSSSREDGAAIVSIISIRRFTDRYAFYRGWAGIYHGITLSHGPTSISDSGQTDGETWEPPKEDIMNPAQELKLNRTLEQTDLTLKTLAQVNDRVYDALNKINHVFEGVDQMLRSLAQINDRAYLSSVRSEAALASLGKLAESLKQGLSVRNVIPSFNEQPKESE